MYGALWALESLGHLVSLRSPGRVFGVPVELSDAPAYPVRGLMVNPAAQFMSIQFLEHVVDGEKDL